MFYFKKTILLSSLLFASAAQSAIITQYGTDISFTYSDSTLFGTGNVVGNSISFLPTNFLAESLNGIGAVSLTDTLNVTVQSTTAGYAMNMFTLAELGDYRLSGATASVDASSRFMAVSGTTSCGTLACSDSGIFSAGTLANATGALTDWNLGGTLDLAATAGWGSDTKVILQLQNNLLASTGAQGEVAFIQKKLGGVGITVNPVPVPAAVWLFGSGLIGLVGLARRKTQS
jgi:hypothetical protein